MDLSSNPTCIGSGPCKAIQPVVCRENRHVVPGEGFGLVERYVACPSQEKVLEMVLGSM